MPSTQYVQSDISNFVKPNSVVLYGSSLKAVKTLQSSIALFGLLSPICVTRKGDKFIILDGHKRLTALHRLRFEQGPHPHFSNIPYVIARTVLHQRLKNSEEFLPLLSNDAQYNLVMDLRDSGLGVLDISNALYTSTQYVRNLLSLDKLSRNLQAAFLDDSLTLSQAHAYGTIENLDAQDKLLELLGNNFDHPSIIQALKAGETVINVNDKNVVCLHSRKNISNENTDSQRSSFG